MDIYHIEVVHDGRCFDEARHSIEAAKAWATDKLTELGEVAEGLEYEEQGDDLVVELSFGVRVTISPR